MGFVKEFKEFAMKGNVVDLAVGVIIGGAFGKIISSLVDDIIMPLVSMATGGASFVNKYIPLDGKVREAWEANHSLALEDARKLGAVFAYGSFIQTLINFIILAICIFVMIKAMNNLRKKEEAAAPPAPAGPTQEELLIQIRDLLKK